MTFSSKGKQLEHDRAGEIKVRAVTSAAFLIGLILSGLMVWQFESDRIYKRHLAATELSGLVATDIQGNLNRSLSATYALAAVIRQGNGKIEGFPQLATEMLALYPGIGSLQLAPNGVIEQIIPLKGNEKAIGHNLLEDTKRNKEAILAVRTKSLTLAGPFELIQGGKAIIGRLPIFMNKGDAEYFWGFSSVLIRIHDFLKVINIQRIADNHYSYELYRIHPDTGKKDVFSSAGTAIKSPVSKKIQVPNGEWILALEPMAGWYSPVVIASELFLIAVFSSFLALVAWFLTRQPIILKKMIEERTEKLTETNYRLQAEINEREHVQEALKASENKLRSIFESLTDVIIILDADGTFVEIAPTRTDHLSRPPDALLGKKVSEVFPQELAGFFLSTIKKVLSTGEIVSVDYSLTHESREIWFTGNVSLLTPSLVVWSARDITRRKLDEEDRRQLELQLLHAQKLESLGVLAGGIAHDFNNILMAIIGNADLALMRINKESPAAENLHHIEKAAARAADLAKQMLAYSGKGKFVIENIDLNCLLEDMLHMLEVSISKKAVLRLNLTTTMPTIEADATQMRQIIMNLVINASEAIGEKSGVIAITTGCMDCDKNYLQNVWLDENITAGLYVYLEIADTGCGMDRETLSKLFDPFFTTKFTGRGLGMAAVLGIVRSHKGAIKVYSEPGKGTTFKILLPASNRPVEIFNSESHKDDWKGSGTVLLVDDEETVRGIGKEMLQELGFTIITANDGRDAVDMFKSTPNIDFVILDLTMPHMDGEQCFRELKKLKPDVKVIISSGYNEQEVTQKFIGKGVAGFIQKPYKLSVLKEAFQKI